MRAITITRHGGPEVLEVREGPDPTPGPDEVRVRVRACGLNFAELMARQGLYPDAPKPPCVVGYEAAGEVDQVGARVREYAPGDRVLLARRFGAHADVVCAPERQVYPMPEGMSFEDAAALPVNYLTAYHMLFKAARVAPGERVLIHSAAGGVGTALLQLCRTIEGVETFGTASASKHAHVRAMGCDHPIDYHTEDYAEAVMRLTERRGVDVVFDALGGRDWKKGYELLRPAGRLVAFGFANMATGPQRNIFQIAREFITMPRWHPLELMQANRAIVGVSLGDLWDEVELLREHMIAILGMVKAGQLTPHVDSVFSFAEAAAAHEHMQARRNVGKIILVP